MAGPRRHPAEYSDIILDAIRDLIPSWGLILDPFAGVGGIHKLSIPGKRMTFGIEIESEWAEAHPRTSVGDATNLTSDWTGFFDAVVTSPVYGNRMSDHHEAKDRSWRNTYTHALGRPLTDGNAGKMQWPSVKYRDLHRQAWAEVYRVLKPGGRFVLNVSDHIREGERQPVTKWHVRTILDLGFDLVEARAVQTPRQRFGANGQLRVPYESVIAFDKET